MQFDQLKQHEFLSLLGAATAWPLAGVRSSRTSTPWEKHACSTRRSERALCYMTVVSTLETAQMTRFILLAAFTIVGQHAAVAAPVTATGPTALPLAAVIAQHSPLVRAFDKRIIARLFGGRINFGFTPNKTISVTADSVVCRTSNVDITARTCDLTFGDRKRTLSGREANEVSATGLTAGASSEGPLARSLKAFRSWSARSTRMRS
jgi:hypothetical protein